MNTPLPARPDRPLPFTPADLPADRILVRAGAAHAVAAARGMGARPEQICREYWPRDSASHAFVTRAATVQATIGGSGWADTLAAKAVGAFIGSLQTSAAAQLIAAGLQLNLPGFAQITLPRATSTGTPQWISEGSPIPVGQAVIGAPTLGPPKKLGLIEVVTREISEAAPEDAETIVGTILRDAMARQLDLSLFSATAADATRPAGILNGISAVTATPDGGVNAAISDLRSLTDATVTAGGSGAVMFFASPGRVLAVKGYVPALGAQTFGSAAIAAGTLIAVDAGAFASMFGANIEIRASIETVLHMEDTTPLQIGTAGPTVAAPSRSMFQTDCVAIRAVLRAAWALRIPAAAWISTGMTW